jgi:two-component system, response regulator PdtaR
MMRSVCNDDSILIVEDDALLSGHISEVLVELAFVVAGRASSGAEALAFVEQNRPMLALVDIHLSGPMDGVELALDLRKRFGVPSIFLSGMRDDRTIERARAAGPLGFLQKPFRPSHVFNAITRAFADLAKERSAGGGCDHRADRRLS